LPLPYEKKGGGIRVKRLLTYDPGIEEDGADKMLYGHEYFYIDLDGKSSGIASNEPIEGREENALITYLHKRDESDMEQVLAAGHDKSQFEGPIGENLLPFPSVGYARVVVRNIHSAPTNDGISTFEFYTTKDYPYDKKYKYTDEDTTFKYRGIQYTDLNYKSDNDTKFGLFSNRKILNTWATQGYKFIINSMNGQPKKQSMYSGKWSLYNKPDSLMEISSTRYNYFEPAEPLPILDEKGKTLYVNLGKASEIIAESKKVSDETESANLSIEIGFSITYAAGIPIPWIIPIPYFTEDQTDLHTHVTTQIDYFPPVLKSITNYQDGTYKTITNLYFDKLNGDPIVSSQSGIYDKIKYSDGNSTQTHHGKYFTYTIPATFNYPELGQKGGYEGFYLDLGTDPNTDDVVIEKNSDDNGIYFEFSGNDYCNALEKFTAGDLIALEKSSVLTAWNIVERSANRLYVEGATGLTYSETTNLGNNMESIRIVQSGRPNILTLSSAGITTYGKTFEGLSDKNSSQVDYRESLADYLNTIKNGAAATLPQEAESIYYSDSNGNTCSACSSNQTLIDSGNDNFSTVMADLTNLLNDNGFSYEYISDLLVWIGDDEDRLSFAYEYLLTEVENKVLEFTSVIEIDDLFDGWQSANIYFTDYSTVDYVANLFK
jgi:hypothetical protein